MRPIFLPLRSSSDRNSWPSSYPIFSFAFLLCPFETQLSIYYVTMVLIRDLAAALALASAAFAFEFPGLGNEQSGLAPRGAAALEDVLDRFLKRDVSGLDAEFADLSARDIEDLIARDPQVAELVQNLGEQFVKRDGSEITTRDLQLVTRSAAAGEAAGTGLWSAVKSVFARDLDEDDLLARDLDILQENFVRRDGAEISYDDLALLTRDAPKAQAPIAQMEKKLKKEEKALDKAEDKIAKGEKNLAADMLNFVSLQRHALVCLSAWPILIMTSTGREGKEERR